MLLEVHLFRQNNPSIRCFDFQKWEENSSNSAQKKLEVHFSGKARFHPNLENFHQVLVQDLELIRITRARNELHDATMPSEKSDVQYQFYR